MSDSTERSAGSGRRRIAKAQTRRQTTSKARVEVKHLNLALQGGGAHGAFTWGVLDRLLEQENLRIEGVSCTSAGVMNAAVMACGLSSGGPAGARRKLEDFWRRISDVSRMSPLQRTPFDRMSGNWNMDDSPLYLTFDLISRVMSPYLLNPLGHNPLRDVLDEVIDLDCLHHCVGPKLFVTATNVRTGKIRVFENPEISIDALLASACVPTLFQAVEIDGEPYWDGGFMGNPALYPLFYNCDSGDVAIVQINPIVRDKTPKTAREILDRINEISFNSSLMREMRAVAFVGRLIDRGLLDEKEYKKVRIHLIEAEDEMNRLGYSSKLVADWEFLTHLRDLGRRTADAWLGANFELIGLESSLDIRAKFL